MIIFSTLYSKTKGKISMIRLSCLKIVRKIQVMKIVSEIKNRSKVFLAASVSRLKNFRKLYVRGVKKTRISFRKQIEQWFDRVIGSRFTTREQCHFAKRFAFLIKAGVPILDSLHVLRDQSKSKSHARVFDKIIHDVSNGQTLSKSFGKFPNLFNDFAIYIIKVGESSGTLSQNLTYLAEELKKKQALKRKVIAAFIYPVIVTLASIAIIGFLMVYLFPKIMPVFTSLHVELPITTRIVIFASTALQHWGPIILLVVVLFLIIFFVILKKSLQVRFLFDRFSMELPIVGTIICHYNVANASRTLGLLLRSGVSLSGALPITADTTAHRAYKREFNELALAVNRGEEISGRLLKRKKFFPDMFGHMIAVGEKSGTLSETLVYLSELYDNEMDDFTKNLSTLIEPALMICMGVVVGFIAISIITPIYGITQSLHG